MDDGALGSYPCLLGGIKEPLMHAQNASSGSGFVRMSAFISFVGMYDTVALPEDTSWRI